MSDSCWRILFFPREIFAKYFFLKELTWNRRLLFLSKMARNSGRSSSRSRPASRSASTTSRSSSSSARTPVATPASSVPAQPQMAPQQPSLFANMASTAAGVAVGSTIGHTLGSAAFHSLRPRCYGIVWRWFVSSWSSSTRTTKPPWI